MESTLNELLDQNEAEINFGFYWTRILKEVVLKVPEYRKRIACSNSAHTRVFAWSQGKEGELSVDPIEADFPLLLQVRNSAAATAPQAGVQRRTSPEIQEVDEDRRAAHLHEQERQPAGGRHVQQGPGAVPTPARNDAGDLAGVMEQVLSRVLTSQQSQMQDGLSQLAESIGRGPGTTGRRGKLSSTIKVEPRMPWPEFSDKNKNPEDAENFVKQFEAICRMANNGEGMRHEDMVYTIRKLSERK